MIDVEPVPDEPAMTELPLDPAELGMAELAQAWLTEPDWADPLVRRRTLPPRGISAYLPMRDGWPVRTLRWARREDGPGNILIVTGRADFAEKYAETLHDLTEAGWGVAIFDWRGQGLSRRLGKTPQHGASPGFGVWLDDLRELLAWAAADDGPVHVMAHSMGGHLLLRHLAAGGANVARAVVLAPMVGLAGAPLGPFATRLLTTLQMLRGHARDYVLGGGPWRPGMAGDRRQTMLTSDPERYGDENWWIGQYPSLALGSVTWGWLDDAFASIAALNARRVAEAITTPLLALVPARDALVDSAATQRFIKRVPGGRCVVYPNAGHELLREAEPLRGQVLGVAVEFLTTGQ